MEDLQGIASQLVAEQPGGAPFATPAEDLLTSWACDGDELAPVAAVVGGVVANHVIRAVSGVGLPIKNLFCFSIWDNMGQIDDMPLVP